MVGDGLKPVSAAHYLRHVGTGPGNRRPNTKSLPATWGDVLGKFHPHGDMPVTSHGVMAQPFLTLPCWLDGQGNWGSPDDQIVRCHALLPNRVWRASPSAAQRTGAGYGRLVPNFLTGTMDDAFHTCRRAAHVLLQRHHGHCRWAWRQTYRPNNVAGSARPVSP